MRYVLIVLAALLPGLVRAADAHAAPAGHAPVAAPVAAAPATLAAASAPSKAPPRKGFEDPMDRLRERLAAKLSAGSTADVSAPGVVKVVNHGVAPAPAAAAATAALAAAPAAAGHGAAPPAPPRAVRAPAAAPAHVGHDIHWDYQGPGGPSSWGQLKPEFATCATGTRQSPIDIRDGIRVQLDPVQFDYRPSSFRVIDNGHTVQVDVGGGNAIDVLGKRYELLQFHFHRPSEERIEGRQFDMVAHLVHKSADGRLAVVAVLLEQGRAHPIVQAVWNNLPLDKGEDVAARASLDLNALLPEDRRYYTYMGSLTTPPCSEGVLWMVMRQPVQLSSEQVGVFARLYPMNARPIQQAAGRLIKQGE